MMSSTTFAFLALSALGLGGQGCAAGPDTTFATSTVRATQLPTPSASPAPIVGRGVYSSCTAIDVTSAFICGQEGSISDDSGAWDNSVTKPSEQACAEYCASAGSCTTFYYSDGWCQLFGNPFSTHGFSQEDGGKRFWQLECFECSKESGVILNLDFSQSDGDIGKWTMVADDEEAFFMDVQQYYKPDGSIGQGLRVGEVTGSGQAWVRYLPTFKLHAGVTYKLSLHAKSSIANGPGFGADFTALNTKVYNNEETIFGATLGKGESVGKDWYYWQFGFTATDNQEGKAAFGIGLETTGSAVDWWFDNISIERV